MTFEKEFIRKHTIGGTVIKACDVVKDLRVQIDKQLKFHDHTTAVTKKANHTVAIIRKKSQHFDKTIPCTKPT